jgi:hypothetical protein
LISRPKIKKPALAQIKAAAMIAVCPEIKIAPLQPAAEISILLATDP